jgi:hypothetical protein
VCCSRSHPPIGSSGHAVEIDKQTWGARAACRSRHWSGNKSTEQDDDVYAIFPQPLLGHSPARRETTHEPQSFGWVERGRKGRKRESGLACWLQHGRVNRPLRVGKEAGGIGVLCFDSFGNGQSGTDVPA